jgi:hypothetical protein
MNGRITELAEQCGFRSMPDIYDRNQAFDIPRFAELIVAECARAYHQTRSVDTTVEQHFRNHLGLDQ